MPRSGLLPGDLIVGWLCSIGEDVTAVGMMLQWGHHRGRGCHPDGDVTAAVPLSPAGH